jgi:hypothetical protein
MIRYFRVVALVSWLDLTHHSDLEPTTRSRFNTCVTRERLTPRWRARAALLSNFPLSSSDW